MKQELDLSHDCHVCGSPLQRDMKNKTERCVHYACSAKNIDFSIRVKEVKE